MPFLHMFQQVLHIRVLFLAEAAVLLHLQMDSLYVDLQSQKHRITTRKTEQVHVQKKFNSSGRGNHGQLRKIREHNHNIKSTSLGFSQRWTSITKKKHQLTNSATINTKKNYSLKKVIIRP